MLDIDTYTIIPMITSTIIFVMGISLLTISTPKEPDLRNYRISRRLLAIAYIILALLIQSRIWGETEHNSDMSVEVFTLIAASFQALLFTLSAVTLINPRYITKRWIRMNIIPMLFFSAILAILFFTTVEPYLYPFFGVMLALYCLQLVYYIMIFVKEYSHYRQRLDNYFSGDEYRRLRWVGRAFYMAACVGILSVASLFVNKQVFTAFMITYTTFYVYFALKFINYVTLFHHIAPIISEAENQPSNNHEISVQLRTSLSKWIEKKKFTDPTLSLKSLSGELNTNPAYLSRFINTEYGQNFRSWVNSVRISEAQKLILQDSNIPLIEVGEKIGIPSSSTFYRQFVAVTGMTPMEYRRELQQAQQRE